MSHWLWIALVVEGASLVSWLIFLATKQLRYAFIIGFDIMLPVAAMHLLAGSSGQLPHWRALAVLASVVLYLIEMNLVIVFWTENTALSKLETKLRRVDKHLLPLIMANGAGWLYCLPFFFVARRTGPLDWQDIVALALFVIGTVIHVAADGQKRRFKRDPDNHDRLLDTGLWRLSRHPNYFGDLLVYIAWAVVAANPWAWLCPAMNLLQYLFDAIPKNERWAAEHYGQAWTDYAANTSRFVPWRPKDAHGAPRS
jgi:steroid 5-alpha reductase family enzyme